MIGDIPFGIDEAYIEARDGTGALSGTEVEVLGATSISFNTDSDVQEARGSNALQRVRRGNKSVSGSLGSLSHNPTMWAIFGDGATSTTGTTPAQVTTYTEPAQVGDKHYQITAQAYDGAAAVRVAVLDVITTSGPGIDWSTDAYSEPSIDFQAQPSAGSFFTLAQYETGVPIVP